MKTIEAHGKVGDFIFWFNLFCQKVYNGGVLRLKNEAEEEEPDGTIGKYVYVNDGSWTELPALSVDYRNGFLPFGSYVFTVEGHAFTAGFDFYLYRGVNRSEVKEPKQEGTFRVKNDAKFLAQKVAEAWRRLGGTAKLKRDHNALVCVGKSGVWVSLYA
jgi:hypothetical protein